MFVTGVESIHLVLTLNNLWVEAGTVWGHCLRLAYELALKVQLVLLIIQKLLYIDHVILSKAAAKGLCPIIQDKFSLLLGASKLCLQVLDMVAASNLIFYHWLGVVEVFKALLVTDHALVQRVLLEHVLEAAAREATRREDGLVAARILLCWVVPCWSRLLLLWLLLLLLNNDLFTRGHLFFS